MQPQGDMPDELIVNGHLFIHVAACSCPRIQGMTGIDLCGYCEEYTPNHYLSPLHKANARSTVIRSGYISDVPLRKEVDEK